MLLAALTIISERGNRADAEGHKRLEIAGGFAGPAQIKKATRQQP